MHVLWMEWKTCRAEESRSELYPKNDCSWWQIFSVNLHLLVTLSYLQADKPVALNNIQCRSRPEKHERHSVVKASSFEQLLIENMA